MKTSRWNSATVFVAALFNSLLVVSRWAWQRRKDARARAKRAHLGLGALAFLLSASATHAESPPAAHALAIDEGVYLTVNGVEQWVTIRSQDASNPVLLFLHGGPGVGNSTMAPFFSDWEKSFTLVQWDQPGGGFTDLHNVGKERGPMTVKRFVGDGISVTEQVLARLHAKKLVLVGNSWGTLIGVEMVKARPELFSAYVGTSQAVGDAGNKLGWQLALDAAKKRNDAAAVAALEKVGPPPYKTFEDLLVRQMNAMPPVVPMSDAEKANSAAQYQVMMTPSPPGSKYVGVTTVPAGYDFIQNFYNTQRTTFQETWSWEARKLGMKFKMPVFIYQGSDDMNTPLQTAREYYEDIKAPKKGFAVIEGASHNTIAFQADILKLLERDVLPLVAHDAKVAQR